MQSVAAAIGRRAVPQVAVASSLPARDMRLKVQAKLSQLDAVSPSLIDSFARKHTYLRISLTERCNLRCTYCMPLEGVPLSPDNKIMSDKEVVQVAKTFVDMGVRKIRLTGGEPMVRKGIADIISELGKLKLDQLGMTSNGIALHRKLPSLVASGLTHLNLSLDTLVPSKFPFLTRRPSTYHSAVMQSLDVALGLGEEGLTTKINVVVMKGLNEDELAGFVELTREKNVIVRFIEWMPFTGNKYSMQKFFSYQDMLSTIRSSHPGFQRLASEDDPNDTTKHYGVPGFKGKVGFITSMTEHFCGTCNRLRVTADGNLKPCLFSPAESSLLSILRTPMIESERQLELEKVIGKAVGGKKKGHEGVEAIARESQKAGGRSMILIDSRRRRPAVRPTLWPSLLSRPNSNLMSLRVYSSVPPSDEPYTTPSEPRLTHMNYKTGRPHMVSISAKASTARSATASGRIFLPQAAFDLLSPSSTFYPRTANKKGDALAVAHLAGIMAAKRTSDLIPLCHQINLSSVDVVFESESVGEGVEGGGGWVKVNATAECAGGTGVEMEALTSVSVALLTVWDMVKAVAGKEMVIEDIKVVAKSGGKSGDWTRTP